jgi:hypothetical protein
MPYYGHRNYWEHEDVPPDYCPHGVNRDYAECGPCLDAQVEAERELNAEQSTQALTDAVAALAERKGWR